MEAIFFLLDVGLMIVLLFGVLRAERGKGAEGKSPNLGFFAFKERPDETD